MDCETIGQSHQMMNGSSESPLQFLTAALYNVIHFRSPDSLPYYSVISIKAQAIRFWFIHTLGLGAWNGAAESTHCFIQKGALSVSVMEMWEK